MKTTKRTEAVDFLEMCKRDVGDFSCIHLFCQLGLHMAVTSVFAAVRGKQPHASQQRCSCRPLCAVKSLQGCWVFPPTHSSCRSSLSPEAAGTYSWGWGQGDARGIAKQHQSGIFFFPDPSPKQIRAVILPFGYFSINLSLYFQCNLKTEMKVLRI